MKRFSRLRVLVIGDMMLDQYLMGRVSRISPDAPVPVVDVQSEKFFPGGASNVALNLRSLSARVAVLGVVGQDAVGQTLAKTLHEYGIETTGLLKDSDRPTTLKTRIFAQHQQMIRFDRENRSPVSTAICRKALEYARRAIPQVDAVLFEDYGKGLVQQNLLDACMEIARLSKVPTFADPNAHHRLDYRGLTGITPNRSEAFWMAGEPLSDPAPNPLDDRPLLNVGNKLLQETQSRNILVTLSEQGMCLFRKNHPPQHIPTSAPAVFDASGAGDTTISAFTLGFCSGLDAFSAAYLSSQAAGIVVGKPGIATVTTTELLNKL